MATPLRSLTGALRSGSACSFFGLSAIASSSKRPFASTPLFRDGQRTTTTTHDLPPHLQSSGTSDTPTSPSRSAEPDPLALSPSVTEFLTTPSYTAEGQRDPAPHRASGIGSSLQTQPGRSALRSIPFENPRSNERATRYLPIEPLVLPLPTTAATTPSRIYSAEDYASGSTVDAPSKHSRVTHILNVKCTRNNVHLTFVDKKGCIKNMGTISAGHGGVFKKGKRSSYEAAYQAGLKMFDRILGYARRNVVQVCVAYSGLGGIGREAIATAMTSPEGSGFTRLVVRIEDRTPILMGGPRPRSKRSV